MSAKRFFVISGARAFAIGHNGHDPTRLPVDLAVT